MDTEKPVFKEEFLKGMSSAGLAIMMNSINTTVELLRKSFPFGCAEGGHVYYMSVCDNLMFLVDQTQKELSERQDLSQVLDSDMEVIDRHCDGDDDDDDDDDDGVVLLCTDDFSSGEEFIDFLMSKLGNTVH